MDPLATTDVATTDFVTMDVAELPQSPKPAISLFQQVLNSRSILSDNAARNTKLYEGTSSVAEMRERYEILTGRQVKVSDGTTAYARGHFPRGNCGGGYLYPPASNPLYPHDITSFAPHAYGLALNNAANVPQVIAWIDEPRMFIPHPETYTPNLLLTESGDPELGINGEVLRDLKILPRYISSEVEGWRLHYWFTCDKRIDYSDIIARMNFKCTPDGGEGPLAAGTWEVMSILQSRIDEFRCENGILAPLASPFDPNTYEVTSADIQAVSRLLATQLQYGTWWAVDELHGVMYPPPPKDPNAPWQLEQYLLPIKGGISPRVQKILEYMEPTFPQQMPVIPQMQTMPQTATPQVQAATQMQTATKRQTATKKQTTPRRQTTPQTPRTARSTPTKKRSASTPNSPPAKRSRTNSQSLLNRPFFELSPTQKAELIFPVFGMTIPEHLKGLGANRQLEALQKHFGKHLPLSE